MYLLKEALQLDQIRELMESGSGIGLPESRIGKVVRCREFLDRVIKESEKPVYGVNTGFGSLYNRYISNSDLSTLQENLVKSHSTGTGDEIPKEIVQLMLLLKVHGLAQGHSGSQLEVVEMLIELYNRKIYPVVYRYGSLGASGDLAPLAHMSLPLIGEGNVNFKGKRRASADVLRSEGLQPVKLKAKDGLALLNGTQFMTAHGTWCLIHAKRLVLWANTIASLSLDVFDGRKEPFDPEIHKTRPHKGQCHTAEHILRILDGSELQEQPKVHVQDPYSFRCVPQVHGASWDAIDHVEEIFVEEINSVTDNPVVFPESGKIISAGNFHGQPLALALDYLAMALAELGNISERRTYQLISGQRDLPNYLVANPGINSGLMIPQYTAAHLVSYNKQLANPSSTDSIVSSNGQEDHVSMGSSSALRCYDIVRNLYSILAIEWLTACQALEFKRPLKSSPGLEDMVGNFRERVTFIDQDRILHEDLRRSEEFLKGTDPLMA